MCIIHQCLSILFGQTDGQGMNRLAVLQTGRLALVCRRISIRTMG